MRRLAFLLAILLIPTMALATTYTPSTETDCIGKVCTQVIYSGVRFADDKGTKIENAKSLKGVEGITLNIKQDANFPVDVLDYNSTHITLRLNITLGQRNKDIPILVYDTYNESAKFVNFTIRSSIGGSNQQTMAYGLGRTLKFGFNSTTITLNESNGGNLGDSYGQSGNPNNNYGITTSFSVGFGSPNLRMAYIMWNMSVIPSGSIITNANFSVYSSNINFNIIAIYNTSPMNTTGTSFWNQGTLNAASCVSGINCNLDSNITYNNKPSRDILQSLNTSAMIQTRNYFNVTNAAITSFANTTYQRMSLVIVNSTQANLSNSFSSKEDATASRRPQLVITYTEAGDSTPPTYNLVGSNSSTPIPLEQVLHYANWSDETGLSGYIFSWNATGVTCSDGMANDTWVGMSGVTNWSNVTKQMPAACAGKTIDFKFYANDTSNNWNVTTDTYENETSGGDTCTYTTGDYYVDTKDNCTLSNLAIGGTLWIYSTGYGMISMSNVTSTSFRFNGTYDRCGYYNRTRIA